MRGMVKDGSAPIIERFHAQYAAAQALWGQGKWEESRRANGKALRLAAAATPEQRAEFVPTFVDGGSRFTFVPVAEHIDEELRVAKLNEAGLRPGPLGPAFVETVRTALKNNPGENLHCFWNRWPVAAHCEADRLANLKAHGKAACDRREACAHCGVGCNAAGVTLLRCGKCGLAFYCSQACQRAGWAAHRPQCRAPGKHRAGDVVRLQSVDERPELNGQYMLVVGRDPAQAGSWTVENSSWPQGAQRHVVPQKSVRRVLTH